jgi:ABC-type multidrug transport system fused ATPase/permease subunit
VQACLFLKKEIKKHHPGIASGRLVIQKTIFVLLLVYNYNKTMARRVLLKDVLEHKFSWKELAKAIWFLLDLGGTRRRYVIFIILLFIVLGYSIVPPLIIGSIVNFFTNYKSGDSFSRFYLLSALLGGSMIIISFFRLTLKSKLSLLANISAYQIKVKGFELLLSQSLLETSKGATGEKVQKIQNGIDSFYLFFRIFTNQILSAAASMSGILVVFIYLRLTYALFFLAYIILFFAILIAFNRMLQKLNFERYEALEKSSGAYVEGLSNITTLKSMGSEKHFQSRIVEKEKVSKEYSDKITITINNQWKVFQTLNGISAGMFLFFIGRDVLSGILNVGEIVIFYSYFENMRSFGDQIMNMYSDLVQSKSGIGRLADVFKSRIKSDEKEKNVFPADWKDMQISSGSFFYKPGVGLKNINLKIKRGEKIGIVGKTGGGKSTIAKIMLGLYPLKAGRFEIDGRSFYDIKSEEIFKNISVVPQDIEMFNMSLVDNITLFRDVDEALLEKAISIAHLQEVVDTLPKGLDTTIGEKGYKLSGGERQRLAIARAICQKSQILILDEATSSLDTRTEKSIYEALEKNFPDKTIIAVAHRTKTLEKTDKIYVFKGGAIVEGGKYTDLINDEKSYLFDISRKTTKRFE